MRTQCMSRTNLAKAGERTWRRYSASAAMPIIGIGLPIYRECYPFINTAL